MARQILAMTAMIGLFITAGCYQPGGSFMPKTGDAETFWSYQTAPKTIRITDLRNKEVIFELDVPAGRQFTYQFVKGQGDDPVLTPDLMRYEIFPMGTMTGSLTNSMTVPAFDARRIDVYVTQKIEYDQPEPGAKLRTDQLEDRPEWWTPEGGPMPDDKSPTTNYDG